MNKDWPPIIVKDGVEYVGLLPGEWKDLMQRIQVVIAILEGNEEIDDDEGVELDEFDCQFAELMTSEEWPSWPTNQ